MGGDISFHGQSTHSTLARSSILSSSLAREGVLQAQPLRLDNHYNVRCIALSQAESTLLWFGRCGIKATGAYF
jgi:hypothetical protein